MIKIELKTLEDGDVGRMQMAVVMPGRWRKLDFSEGSSNVRCGSHSGILCFA